MLVEMPIEGPLHEPGFLGRNHSLRSQIGDRLENAVGIVGFVGGYGIRINAGQQVRSLRHIVSLACGQRESRQVAQSFDQRMNLGGQSAARVAERLITVFFGAPAAC